MRLNISHCSECGTAYEETNLTTWPRVCIGCPTLTWNNPKPVVCVVQPVLWWDAKADELVGGIVMAKRAIQPMKGHWSLVGGFMEINESVEEAAMREFREETSLEVAMEPRIVWTGPVGDGGQLMLMTVVDKPLELEVFKQGKPCSENEELGILLRDSGIKLAFPTHQIAAQKFFNGEYDVSCQYRS